MRIDWQKPKYMIFISFSLLSLGLAIYIAEKSEDVQIEVTRNLLADKFGHRRFHANDASKPVDIRLRNGSTVSAQLTINHKLQSHIEMLFNRYRPDYAAFVAMDAETGQILAIADYSKKGHEGNLAIRSSFPAASVFKVVTSAAAIEDGGLAPHSRIPFNGSATSLYKRNLDFRVNRWTRFVSLENALARSINSVFGKIAAHGLGQQVLQRYANSFLFNKEIDFDLPLQESSADVPQDQFGLAESGSGYTRDQTISPVHGAMIAAAIINDGWMPKPYLVESVSDQNGDVLYEYKKQANRPTVLASTAQQLASMMEQTIVRGTARKHYRDYRRHSVLSNLFIGGKTGSLTGYSPRGKYDWFVGFAQDKNNPGRKIAFASMIVNGKFWRVKSSYLARQIILKHFEDYRPVNLAHKKRRESKRL